VVRITSTRAATEEIHLVPVAQDYALPYTAQRLRVTEVRVAQQGIELYRAQLVGHRRPRCPVHASIQTVWIRPCRRAARAVRRRFPVACACKCPTAIKT